MKVFPVEIRWHPGLSVYASPGFLGAVSDEYGWLGGGVSADAPQFLLPYTLVTKPGVRMVRFRVETIVQDEVAGTVEAEREFLEAALVHFAGRGAHVIIPASTNTLFRTHPRRAAAVPYGSYVMDLTASEEALWQGMHPKHRNVIKSAERKGVVIAQGAAYARPAYDMIARTFQRSAMGFMSLAAFERMLAGLGEYVRIFVAIANGTIQGCAVIPFSQHSAYYAYGGTAEGPVTGATNLLQWEAMRQFKALGTRNYDFCGARLAPDAGSKAAGLVMYKERFGGRLARGYMWKCPLHPLRARVYNLGVRLLKGGDIVDQERRRASAVCSPSV